MKWGQRHSGPYGPENPDPAPDCYIVARLDDDTFVVRHYPNRDAQKPCCVAKVSRKHEDESDVDVLLRASSICDGRHAEQLVEAIA